VQDGLSVEFNDSRIREQASYTTLNSSRSDSEYRSTDAGPAPGCLNRLGSQQWAKTKARVRKAMQEMTGELLKLYAERTTAQGNAFSKAMSFKRSLKTPSITTRPTTSYPQSAPSSTTWNLPRPMDGCSAAMWATGNRSRHAARLQACRTHEVVSSRPRRLLSSSIVERSRSALRSSPINMKMISRFPHGEGAKGHCVASETGKG